MMTCDTRAVHHRRRRRSSSIPIAAAMPCLAPQTSIVNLKADRNNNRGRRRIASSHHIKRVWFDSFVLLLQQH